MTKRRFRYATTLSFGSEDSGTYSEVDVEVSYTVTWGAPETPPCYSHGGLPADPDEIDDIRVEKVNGEPRPWDMGFGFVPDDAFAEMVTDRLDTDEHYARMLEEASETELSDHDAALEAQWEERRLEQD